MLKLVCTESLVPGKSLTEKGHYLAQIGYSGMAIFPDPATWNDKLTREVLDMEKTTGVKVCEVVFMGDVYGHLMDKDPKLQRQAIELYKQSIALCNQLGAITEMEYQYCAQDPLPLFDPYQKMPAEEERVFIDIIREFDSVLEPGAHMLIETINRYESKYLNSMADCKAIVQKAGTKHVGILADFFHMAIEEASIPDAILDGGELIKYIHLGDNNRLAPGFGSTNWKAAVAALKKIGYDGYMNLECKLSGNLKTELKRIKQFFSDIEATL